MPRIEYRVPDNIQQGTKFRVPKDHPLKSFRNVWLWYLGPSGTDPNKHLVVTRAYLRYGLRDVTIEDIEPYGDLRIDTQVLSWPYSVYGSSREPIRMSQCYWLTTKELHLCAVRTEPKYKGLSTFLIKHGLIPGCELEGDQHLVYDRAMYEAERGVPY